MTRLAELKNPVISREQITCFVYGFRKLDPGQVKNRQLIIDSFINSIYLYDDRLVIVYNYNDLTEAIKLKDLEEKIEHDNEPSTFVFDRVFGQMIYLNRKQ